MLINDDAMKSRHLFLTCWFLLCLLANITVIAFNNNQIIQMIDKFYPNALIGLSFQDANAGEIIYQYQQNRLLSPASNIKVFLAVDA